jgi:hypothetical protein
MKPRQPADCARCGGVAKQRKLNDLLQFDRNQPVIALCNQCLHSLRYADAYTWKWFRVYRGRLSQER